MERVLHQNTLSVTTPKIPNGFRRRFCIPATHCLARGLESVAAGSLLSMPKEELLDSLGSTYHLLQREGQWMAKEGGEEGMCAVNAALLAALHMLQVWQ